MTTAGAHNTPCRGICMHTSACIHLHEYRDHGSSPPGAQGTAKKPSEDREQLSAGHLQVDSQQQYAWRVCFPPAAHI